MGWFDDKSAPKEAQMRTKEKDKCLACGAEGVAEGDDATLEVVNRDGHVLVRCISPVGCLSRARALGTYCTY
jgi:hypothetical protein